MSFSAVLCKSTGKIYDNIPDISSVTNHKFVPMIDSNPKIIDDDNTDDTSFKINNYEQETDTNNDEDEPDTNNEEQEDEDTNWW